MDVSEDMEKKVSFAPLESEDIEVLILGTMPGDLSLSKGEYYAHPRNKFWKIIAEITDEQLPNNYEAKLALLNRHRIGLWDVVKTANRKGSLDVDICNETPNDLENFMRTHRKIKIIGFNGKKAASLFAKFFTRAPDITYYTLSSTSPANTGISFEEISQQWRQALFPQVAATIKQA